MQNTLCMHYFVSGRVQGVFYRASAQEQANKLGLTGWARNLPDGRVEIVACGAGEKIQQFYQWVKQGPELAQVTEVIAEEIPWQDHSRFAVK